jgi:glycosyltransferase involved in cell wall biosynthesis
VIVEFHEDQDTGESKYPLVAQIVAPGLRHLIRSASGYVVHSGWDKQRFCEKFGLVADSVAVIPHGPYPIEGRGNEHGPETPTPESDRAAKSEVHVLFFGTIRPYKGLEDLVDAFELLPRDGDINWHLDVVGETWEGWVLPSQKIASNRYRADIEFTNRYVTDAELPSIFGRADIVALPYRRSSASGPLHMAMQQGLPVVVTDVGGLPESASGYSGVVFVPPANPERLSEGIVDALELRRERHQDARTWEDTRRLYESFLGERFDNGES